MGKRVNRIHVPAEILARHVLVVVEPLLRGIDVVLRLVLEKSTGMGLHAEVRQSGSVEARRHASGLRLKLSFVLVVSAVNLVRKLVHLVVLDRDGRRDIPACLPELAGDAILYRVGRVVERLVKVRVGVQIGTACCLCGVVRPRIQRRIAIVAKVVGVGQVAFLHRGKRRDRASLVIWNSTILVDRLRLLSAVFVGITEPLRKLAGGSFGRAGR